MRKKLTLLNEYALLGDTLVHVDDVPNGKPCGCVCAECGTALIARNNPKNKKRHHFAHSVTTDCKGGLETILHRLGKQIIEEEKRIILPAESYWEDLEADNGDIISEKEQVNEKWISFESVIAEVDYSEFKPDIEAITKDKEKYFIEIHVTNAVNEEKAAKLKKVNTNCIEVSLDYKTYGHNVSDYESLKSDVLRWAPRHWIVNTDEKDIRSRLRNKLERKVAVLNRQLAKEREREARIERRLQAEKDTRNYDEQFHKKLKESQKKNKQVLAEKVEQERVQWREAHKDVLKILCETTAPDEVKQRQNEVNQQDQNVFWSGFIKTTGIEVHTLPELFTRENLDSSTIINCVESVWRADIYLTFIHQAQYLGQTLYPREVLRWCIDKYGLIEPYHAIWPIYQKCWLDKDEAYRDYLSGQESQCFVYLNQVIHQYFEMMQEANLLDKQYRIKGKDIIQQPMQELGHHERRRNQLAIIEHWARSTATHNVLVCVNCQFTLFDLSPKMPCPLCGCQYLHDYKNWDIADEKLFEKNNKQAKLHQSLKAVEHDNVKVYINKTIGEKKAIGIFNKLKNGQ